MWPHCHKALVPLSASKPPGSGAVACGKDVSVVEDGGLPLLNCPALPIYTAKCGSRPQSKEAALCAASAVGHTDLCVALIEEGADVNSCEDYSMLFHDEGFENYAFAGHAGRLRGVSRQRRQIGRPCVWRVPDSAHKSQKSNSCAGLGPTALHGAVAAVPASSGPWSSTLLVKSDALRCVDILLACKADPNARDHLGRTPLFAARSKAACRALLTAGANVNAISVSGQSALHEAAHAGATETVEWLAAVVSPELLMLADRGGLTPADYAARTQLRGGSLHAKQLLGTSWSTERSWTAADSAIGAGQQSLPPLSPADRSRPRTGTSSPKAKKPSSASPGRRRGRSQATQEQQATTSPCLSTSGRSGSPKQRLVIRSWHDTQGLISPCDNASAHVILSSMWANAMQGWRQLNAAFAEDATPNAADPVVAGLVEQRQSPLHESLLQVSPPPTQSPRQMPATAAMPRSDPSAVAIPMVMNELLPSEDSPTERATAPNVHKAAAVRMNGNAVGEDKRRSALGLSPVLAEQETGEKAAQQGLSAKEEPTEPAQDNATVDETLASSGDLRHETSIAPTAADDEKPAAVASQILATGSTAGPGQDETTQTKRPAKQDEDRKPERRWEPEAVQLTHSTDRQLARFILSKGYVGAVALVKSKEYAFEDARRVAFMSIRHSVYVRCAAAIQQLESASKRLVGKMLLHHAYGQAQAADAAANTHQQRPERRLSSLERDIKNIAAEYAAESVPRFEAAAEQMINERRPSRVEAGIAAAQAADVSSSCSLERRFSGSATEEASWVWLAAVLAESIQENARMASSTSHNAGSAGCDEPRVRSPVQEAASAFPALPKTPEAVWELEQNVGDEHGLPTSMREEAAFTSASLLQVAVDRSVAVVLGDQEKLLQQEAYDARSLAEEAYLFLVASLQLCRARSAAETDKRAEEVKSGSEAAEAVITRDAEKAALPVDNVIQHDADPAASGTRSIDPNPTSRDVNAGTTERPAEASGCTTKSEKKVVPAEETPRVGMSFVTKAVLAQVLRNVACAKHKPEPSNREASPGQLGVQTTDTDELNITENDKKTVPAEETPKVGMSIVAKAVLDQAFRVVAARPEPSHGLSGADQPAVQITDRRDAEPGLVAKLIMRHVFTFAGKVVATVQQPESKPAAAVAERPSPAVCRHIVRHALTCATSICAVVDEATPEADEADAAALPIVQSPWNGFVTTDLASQNVLETTKSQASALSVKVRAAGQEEEAAGSRHQTADADPDSAPRSDEYPACQHRALEDDCAAARSMLPQIIALAVARSGRRQKERPDGYLRWIYGSVVARHEDIRIPPDDRDGDSQQDLLLDQAGATDETAAVSSPVQATVSAAIVQSTEEEDFESHGHSTEEAESEAAPAEDGAEAMACSEEPDSVVHAASEAASEENVADASAALLAGDAPIEIGDTLAEGAVVLDIRFSQAEATPAKQHIGISVASFREELDHCFGYAAGPDILVVTDVLPVGKVPDWNRANSEQAVSKGDYITMVNTAETCGDMLLALQGPVVALRVIHHCLPSFEVCLEKRAGTNLGVQYKLSPLGEQESSSAELLVVGLQRDGAMAAHNMGCAEQGKWSHIVLPKMCVVAVNGCTSSPDEMGQRLGSEQHLWLKICRAGSRRPRPARVNLRTLTTATSPEDENKRSYSATDCCPPDSPRKLGEAAGVPAALAASSLPPASASTNSTSNTAEDNYYSVEVVFHKPSGGAETSSLGVETRPCIAEFSGRYGRESAGVRDGPNGLLITEVLPSGLVPVWNAAHPDRLVLVGDHIVKINGVRHAARMQEELAAPVVRMKLLRYAPFFRIKLEKGKRGLGIRFRQAADWPELMIVDIVRGGALAAHNCAMADVEAWDEVVLPGMSIVEVNSQFECNEMVKELQNKASREVELKIRRISATSSATCLPAEQAQKRVGIEVFRTIQGATSSQLELADPS
eukprot:TRINITY_DN8182_c0_g1_i3.p1 TRINITY_DN8182_c0_g1~~TRINITY_DN8182_c0_g1_i3.p1  ORF type:complete len:1953 (-),score=332.98 TRINITY_DN8182_c0_g1_i3:388-6246(-)